MPSKKRDREKKHSWNKSSYVIQSIYVLAIQIYVQLIEKKEIQAFSTRYGTRGTIRPIPKADRSMPVAYKFHPAV